jgi:hypothetical protein
VDRAKGSSDRGATAAPPDYFDIVVCKDTRRNSATGELLDVLTPSAADKRAVGLGVEPVAQTPAHRGVGVLRPQHDRKIIKPGNRGGPDLDAHRSTLTLNGVAEVEGDDLAGANELGRFGHGG